MWLWNSKRESEKKAVDRPTEHADHPDQAPLPTPPTDKPVASEAPSPGATTLPPEAVLVGPPAWKMGLVVTASALCGGIAVVLWNRRLLTKMREVTPVAHPKQRRLWEDDL